MVGFDVLSVLSMMTTSFLAPCSPIIVSFMHIVCAHFHPVLLIPPRLLRGDKYDAADMIANLEEIPDLEEAQEEDITLKVANAPNVRSNRIQGLQELDHEIMFQLPTSTVSQARFA